MLFWGLKIHANSVLVIFLIFAINSPHILLKAAMVLFSPTIFKRNLFEMNYWKS